MANVHAEDEVRLLVHLLEDEATEPLIEDKATSIELTWLNQLNLSESMDSTKLTRELD